VVRRRRGHGHQVGQSGQPHRLPVSERACRFGCRRPSHVAPHSSTKRIDDLDFERWYGDVFDDGALRAAMTGCDVVYYCVVDTRTWLRDPTPLFRTNVEGLRHVLDAALDADLKKFVFTSTTGILAISDSRVVTEDDPRNWDQGGSYIEARVAAEKC
jgi:dihydroflavonol-4-reductase